MTLTTKLKFASRIGLCITALWFLLFAVCIIGIPQFGFRPQLGWAFPELWGALVAAMITAKLMSIELPQETPPHGQHRTAGTPIHSDTLVGAPSAVTIGTTGSPELLTIIPPTRTSRPSRTGTVENSGVVLGEIEAFRCWQVAGDFLLSMNGFVWLPGEPMTGENVGVDNTNGVHAFKAIDGARYFSQGCEYPTAIGRVWLWGDIIEHEEGYRAQYAKPLEILQVAWKGDGTRGNEIALGLCRRYGLEDKTWTK